MSVKASRFYNSPQLGAAFENIAGMFAPPDSGDLVNYAQAAGLRQKQGIIDQLKSDPRYSGADAGVLADLFDPTNSWAAQDQNTATTRRGQDITAATSITNNKADNQRSFVTDMFGPVSQDALRPAVPASVSGLFGVGEALPQVDGNRSPLSATQVEGQQLLRLIGEGDITDKMQVNDYLGSNTPVKVVGADGKPTFASPGAALGQTAYVDAGSEAKGELYNYVTADGGEGTALFDGKTLVDQSTGAPLPQGVKIYKASAQGTTDQIGMGTNSNRTDAQRLRASVANANTLVNELEKVVVENPAATGLAGDAMSFLQDSGQVLTELTATFGDGPLSAEQMAAVTGEIDKATGGKYNPAYRQARAMILELAYANASMNNPSGEVSMQALAREVDALGQGMMGNDQGLLGVLDVARSRMRRKLGQADVLDGSAPSLTPDQIGGGEAPASGGIPAGWSPEEWGVLTDEEKAQVLNGQ